LAFSHAHLPYNLAVTHLFLSPLKTLTPPLSTLLLPSINDSFSKFHKNPSSQYSHYNHVRHDCSLFILFFIFYSQGEGGPLLFIIEQKILLFGLNQRKMSRP